MIRRPGHLINADLELDPHPIFPETSGFDLDLSIENVVVFGGDEARYRHFLGRGLAALESTPISVEVLAVASLAAWRAGVLELRLDALQRMSAAPPASVAAALGIEVSALGEFEHRQQSNRFGWPDVPVSQRVIAVVGGFHGLGGAFVSPPLSTTPLAREGGFAIHTDSGEWEYDGDVFGGRLTRVEATGPIGEPAGAELSVSPDSYLASLVAIP